MSRETLEVLEQAIKAHAADILKEIPETRPTVMGWVVALEIQTLEGQDVLWDNTYCAGETTSPNTALGLATWLCDDLRGFQALESDEDEEDQP